MNDRPPKNLPNPPSPKTPVTAEATLFFKTLSLILKLLIPIHTAPYPLPRICVC